jgi:hypothetical protein
LENFFEHILKELYLLRLYFTIIFFQIKTN